MEARTRRCGASYVSNHVMRSGRYEDPKGPHGLGGISTQTRRTVMDGTTCIKSRTFSNCFLFFVVNFHIQIEATRLYTNHQSSLDIVVSYFVRYRVFNHPTGTTIPHARITEYPQGPSLIQVSGKSLVTSRILLTILEEHFDKYIYTDVSFPQTCRIIKGKSRSKYKASTPLYL